MAPANGDFGGSAFESRVTDVPVQRYYFHLCDGRDALIDPDGREIGDASTLKSAALREARAIISQEALGGEINLDQFIEVRDTDGKLILKLEFRDAVLISAKLSPDRRP